MTEPQDKFRQIRRRPVTLPGSSYLAAERDVAILLMNTYRLEYLRHMANQRAADSSFQVREWDDELDPPDIVQVTENIEENAAQTKSKFWYDLARKVIEKRMNPERFVRSQFAGLPAAARPPAPNRLGSPAAFRNYSLVNERVYEELSKAFVFQKEYARRQFSLARSIYPDRQKEDVWAEMLEDDDRPMTAMFRYCLAYSLAKVYPKGSAERELFKRVMDGYRTAAACQYVRDDLAYNEIWGPDWLPLDYRERSYQIYKQLYQGVQS